MALAKLLIELEANIAHLTKGMDSAVRDIGKITNAVNLAKKAAIGLSSAFGVYQLTNLGKTLIDTSVKFEKYKASLETILKSQEKASEEFSRLQEFASTTPFTLDQSIEGFIKLKTLGLDPSERSMRSFGNTASAFGRDLTQFVEAVAKASVMEFERLKEFGFKTRQEGEEVRITFQGVTTKLKKNSEDIVKYLTDIGEKEFAGAMERQMERLPGKLSNLEDSFTNLFAAIGESGANDIIGKTADKIAQLVNSLSDLVKKSKELNETDNWILNILSGKTQYEAAKNAYGLLDAGIGYAASTAAALWETFDYNVNLQTGQKMWDAAVGGAELDKLKRSLGEPIKINPEALKNALKTQGTPLGNVKKEVEEITKEREKAINDLQKYFDDLTKMEREAANDRELSQMDGLLKEVRAEQQAMAGRVDALIKGRDELLAVENLTAEEKKRIVAGTNQAIESEALASIDRINRMTRDANKEILESERKKQEELLQNIIELDEKERQAVAQRKQYYADFANDIEERNMSFMQVYRRDMATLTAGFQTGFLDEETFKNSTRLLTDEYNGWIEASRRTAQTMEGSFSDLFFGALQGNLDGFVTNFIAAMDRIVADLAARNLFNWLAGSLGGSGGIGGFLFGGGRATGGAVSAGSAYMVGERGPEYFLPATSGRIEPGGRGGVVINMTVNAQDAASFSRNKTRIAGEMAAEMAYRQRRGDI